MIEIKHLPYEIDEAGNRSHYYETYWKKIGLELLKNHLPPCDNYHLLDFGCGRGEFMKMARDVGYVVCGCDIDPKCVEMSSEYGETKWLQNGSVKDLFNPVDIVSTFHVLEHVENPRRTLLDLASLSKKYVLLGVPNAARFPKLRWSEVNYSNTGHLQTWDYPTLLNLAENHCRLRLVEWAFDSVTLGAISYCLRRVVGENNLIKLETGYFRKKWPQLSTSIIGLFEKK